MRLKRLELTGFKSFADRTELDTVPGVTAVVGPNGSGKSNIADAIRWVLGEQSAKSLRGAKMEDIIFAGSQDRKAVNFCEVALTLDNTDGTLPLEYAEVTVARRVYRSGDSEYLINRQACRLRDVSELFMDTGVGREAYSIIGQGRIEEILSTKSEERRGVFEEAAGIVKFKSRRKEAEKKLAEASQNALRVHDILHELETQLAPLEERSRVARAYQSVAQEADLLQVAVLVGEIDALLERRMQLQAAHEQAKQSAQVSADNESDALATLATLRGQADELDREWQVAQGLLVEATARLEQCEADRRVAFERQEHVIALLEDLRLSRERLQTEIEAVLRERAELAIRQERLATHVDDLRRQLEEELAAQDGGALQTLRAHVDEARAALIERLRELATDRNEMKNLEQQLEGHQRRLHKASEEAAVAQANWQRAKEEADACEAASSAAAARLQDGAAKLQTAQAEVHNKRRTVDERAAKRLTSERELVQVQSRTATLRELDRDMEGFANGPKAAITAGREQRLKGIRGAVAELMSVDFTYTTAMEIALGGSLQHVVVETEADARAAIEYLKKRQLGRATFLPLSTIRGRRVPLHDLQMVKSAGGYLGVAADLVTYDKQYAAIIDSMLGNVLIARTLSDANAIARVLQHRFRIVTLDGDVVSQGGSMTGGSVQRRGSGILGRAKELEELEHKATTMEREVEARTKDLQEAETVFSQASAAVQELTQQQARDTAQMKHEEARLELLLAQIARENERVNALYEEEALYRQEAQEVEASMGRLRAKVQAAENDTQQAEVDMKMWEERIRVEEEEAVGRSDQLTELRIALAKQEEALQGATEAVARLASREMSLRQEDERLQSEQHQAIARVAELRAVLSQCEMSGQQALAQRDSQQERAATLRELRGQRSRALEEAEHAATALRAVSQAAEHELHQLELSRSKTEGELDTKVQILADEHQLGLELARDRYKMDQPLPAARAHLADLKRQLEAFGEVSLGAIEEFERVGERYHFLRGQADDLAQAQSQLEGLIAEIDEEMAKRFKEAFGAIRSQFQDVFRSLFGGGNADVYLLDEASPLTCGIEIVAEPPGKKLQTLSLLSGGERALTALSLLFAILCVKPVPFCVLDEVEAALDEANVSRFADYLREFSHSTQFIVITHRRGTMEAADVLYGVTMQESGVSKLVSVRVLQEDAESA
ncbi:MAG: chromosome segregation protein SMC [Firmicutes bacterium]|nr:chromosome segregation protein SMC [Bacillota bacterium]